MNARLLKQFDAWFGRLLTLLLPACSKRGDCSSPRCILVIRPGGIGDAVLLAPALSALKKQFPQAKLTVLAEKRNAGVFSLISDVDHVLRYDNLLEFQSVFCIKPDLVIETEQYHRLSAVVARLTGTATCIGFATNERARLFHHFIFYSHDDYEIDSFFHLLAPLGVNLPAVVDTPFLSIPAVIKTRVRLLLAPLITSPFVVLFPGASIPERRWGSERFRQVAAGLVQLGYKVVVVGGKEDIATGNAILQAICLDSLNLAGRTTIAETAAILERAVLLISGDSGVLHLAVALGTPTVSLFGPGIAKKWAPRGQQHLVLNKHLSCSPCTQFGYTKPCPQHAICLQQITPEWVLEAAFHLLTRADCKEDIRASTQINP